MTDGKSDQSITELPIVVLARQLPALAGTNWYSHKRGQLLYIKSGVLAVITKQGRYVVAPHQAIWIPAEIEHELIAKTELDFVGIYISPEESQGLAEVCMVLASDDLFSRLVVEASKIVKAYQWHSSSGRLLRLLRDRISLAKVMDTFLPYPTDERLLAITERLQKHPSLKSDLVSWGKFVGVSSRTLTRRFKNEIGMTYSDWRQRLNIQVAIKHLVIGDSVSDIAKMLGYESSSAFIFMFKKQTKVTPNNYLK